MGQWLKVLGAALLIQVAGCEAEDIVPMIQPSPEVSTEEAFGASKDKPRLSGFFEGGNFATVTVPARQGPPETLTIASLKVRVEIVGRMARTEVTQVFHNHTSRRTEGTYTFTLPAGAAISRLAMDVEGKMMEGELVEREKARQIYEKIVRSQKDPALLEWQGGERFKTQIFPIEANADKTIVLAYEVLLPARGSASSYRYSMPNLEGQPGATAIGDFEFTLSAEDAIDLSVSGYPAKVEQRQLGGTVTHKVSAFNPTGPLEVAFQSGGPKGVTRWRAERKGASFFMVDFVPDLPPAASGAARHLVLALDTSAGLGQVELNRSIEVAHGLWEASPEGTRKQIVHGDYSVEVCPEEDITCLKGLKAGGATNLGALLDRALAQASSMSGPTSVVLLSDGVASLGELDADLLQESMLKRIESREIAVHTVAIGHAPDEAFLSELASRGGGHATRMTPRDTSQAVVDALLGRLREPLLTQVEIKALNGQIEGLVPHRPINLARGERLALMGRVDEGRAVVQVSGNYAGEALSWRLEPQADKPVENKLLVGFWARSVIEEMQDKAISRDKIVATSLEYGVMSRYTSFLVLENDAAYKRFEIARRKQAERIVADKVIIKALRKSDDDLKEVLDGQQGQEQPAAPGNLAVNKPPPGPDVATGSDKRRKRGRRQAVAGPDNGRGLGGLGTTGRGGGGGGSGYGMGNGDRWNDRGPRHLVPKIILGRPKVQGSLDKEVIRRVVRRHQREIKYCYETELLKDLNLAGKVVIEFVISATGSVVAATVKEHTLSQKVARCITSKVRRWVFPEPRGGGIIKVSYPFVFSASDVLRSDHRYLERIRDLEARAWELDLPDKAILLAHYIASKETKKASDFFKRSLADLPSNPTEDDVVTLLDSPEAQRFFYKAFTDAAARRLRQPDPPPGLHERLWGSYLTKKDTRGLEETFSKVKMTPTQSGVFLDTLLASGNRASGEKIFASWRDKNFFTAAISYQILTDLEMGGLPKARREVAETLLAQGDKSAELIEDLLKLSSEDFKRDKVAPRVIEYCGEPGAEVVICRRFLTELGQHEQIQDFSLTYNRERLAAVQKARRADIARTDLIREAYLCLEALGQSQAAQRVLSELVEFAPHDHGTRKVYARELSQAKRTQESCAQHALAVQLDPSRRSTFKDMMALRRQHPQEAKGLRSCIVDGVSKLPVTRAVSLVLTWEDPSADVDLHIHEVGGEEIFYSHRESKNNGLLYYDITDGFGPEIYVLGSGPSGEYRLTLVYYSGDKKNLKGTLTVLRNAGAPNETREDRPFVLPVAESSTQIPIGAFTL